MIVTVAVVGMMQSAVHQIAGMLAMRHSLVPASGAMDMPWFMTKSGTGDGCAMDRVLVGFFDHMLVHVVFMRMMEMTIVQVIHVITMAHGRMAATWTMDVGMVFMLRVRAWHCLSPCGVRIR